MRESVVAFFAVAVLGLVAVSAGCGRGASGPATSDEASAPPPCAAAAQKRLSGVRSALAAGRDPSMKCRALVASLDPLRAEREPSAQRLVADVERTCGYDAPLAWARSNLDAIGAGASAATSCVHVAEALTDLRRFGHGEESSVQEIDAAFRRACHV